MRLLSRCFGCKAELPRLALIVCTPQDDVAALASPGQLPALAGKNGCGVALLRGVAQEYRDWCRRRCSASAQAPRPLVRGVEASTAFEILCRLYLLVHPEVREWTSKVARRRQAALLCYPFRICTIHA